jgi:hypothetical protein
MRLGGRDAYSKRRPEGKRPSGSVGGSIILKWVFLRRKCIRVCMDSSGSG